MAKPYQNREIDRFMQEIKDQIQSMRSALELRMSDFEKDTRESLSRIEVTTTNQNGRVGKLERWQSYVIGFCACLSVILFSVLLPVIASFIQVGKL